MVIANSVKGKATEIEWLITHTHTHTHTTHTCTYPHTQTHTHNHTDQIFIGKIELVHKDKVIEIRMRKFSTALAEMFTK